MDKGNGDTGVVEAFFKGIIKSDADGLTGGKLILHLGLAIEEQYLGNALSIKSS